MDEAGNDLLGSCDIPLHLITSAEATRLDGEADASGGVYRGRVLTLPAQPLTLPDHR